MRVLRTVGSVWAWAALTACLVVCAVSILPGVPPLPRWVGWVPTFMAAGSWCVAAAGEFEYRRVVAVVGPEPPRVVLGIPLPAWMQWWVVLVALVLAANFVSALLSQPGTPEHLGAGFFFDDHGTHLATTAAGYRDGLRRELRIMTGGTGAFHLIALVSMRRLQRVAGADLTLQPRSTPR